jgi:PAS domain S-box-containing protein
MTFSSSGGPLKDLTMVELSQRIPNFDSEDDALSIILEGTARVTGEAFFAALVENLSKAMDTHSAWVTEYMEESQQLRALAFWANGQLLTDFIIDMDGTPCGDVIEHAEFIHHPDNIVNVYPKDSLLKQLKAVSYMGVPLWDTEQKILGHLAVLDTSPLKDESRTLKIFQIFAARASAELQRLRVEQDIRKREEKYRRIVETAREGFVLFDRDYKITDVNEMYCKMTGYRREEIIGNTPLDFSPENHKDFLMSNRKDLFSGKFEDFESTIASRDGRLIPVLVHNNILRNDKSEIIGKMAFLTDMTEHKKSLALAGEIQKSLLPQKSPKIPGLDIAGKNITCDEIGGDYFDFLWDLECEGNHFDAVVGDVTGHGVDAALLMTSARAFLRMRASQCGGISQIVTEMNRHLTMDILHTGRFMTMFYISIDVENKNLSWVRAGHDPAIIYDPNFDQFEELKGTGLALGVDKDYIFDENIKTGLVQGQIIAIGTDGIWETFNKDGKMFGKERFREIIRNNAHMGSSDILNAIFNEIDRFSLGVKTADDITLVIIKIEEASREGGDWQI